MDASEEGLARRAREGDVQAFGDLVEIHQGGVYNVCLRLMGERREAEDLAQEAFIRAYQRLHLYDSARPFGPWVRRVAANLCLNRLEAQKRLELPLDNGLEEMVPEVKPGPESHLETAERGRALRRAVLDLPAAYRVVIELRHFEEMSYEEIADRLKIPLSDVKSHLFRARKLLAARIDAYA
jgi:RNA polymerase sigma-70 factor (ECF subfamily)